jgi:AcrR family transcriptional regulator
MKPETPRSRRYRRTQQAILNAAREIIRSEGMAALSMRAIAERIDYSAATLYEYFTSKEEIVETVCGQGQQMLYEYLAKVDAGLATSDYFQQLGLAYIRFALENPDHFLIMFTFAATRQAHDVQMEQRPTAPDGDSAYTLLVEAIRRGIEEGIFRARPGFDVQEMAYAAWSIVHGMAMLRVAHIGTLPMEFDHMDQEAVKALTRGLQN